MKIGMFHDMFLCSHPCKYLNNGRIFLNICKCSRKYLGKHSCKQNTLFGVYYDNYYCNCYYNYFYMCLYKKYCNS